MGEDKHNGLSEMLGISSDMQDYLANCDPYALRLSSTVGHVDYMGDLRLSEIKTIRKLLEHCTITASKHEILHILENTCSHTEECLECPYQNQFGECNRNERIADILLNRLGQYT